MKKRFIFGIVSLIFIAAAIFIYTNKKHSPNYEAWQKNYQFSKDEVFPLEIDEYGLPYTEVKVNNGAFSMLFSTGSVTGIQLELDNARSLRLPRIDKWSAIDSEGNSAGRHSVFKSTVVTAFGCSWENQKIYESSGDEVEGIIGSGILNGKRFTLDYKNKLIGVTDSKTPLNLKDCVVLPMVRSKNFTGLIVVKGQVNGEDTLIQLDTGKIRTAIDHRMAKKLDLMEVEDGYKVESISLGKYTFDLQYAKGMNLKSIEQIYYEPVMISLGSDILSQMVITVDYQRGIVILNQ